MAYQQQISLTKKQRIKTRSWAKFCQFEPSGDTGECSTRTQIRKSHGDFYGKVDSGTGNMTALLYLDKHTQVHLPSLLCHMSLTVQSRQGNTQQKQKEEKSKAWSSAPPPQSMSKQGKEQTSSKKYRKKFERDLCYKRVSVTLWDLTGSSLSPKLAVKTTMQESDNYTSHLPHSLLPFLLFFPSLCPIVEGGQHNEFWQLKTTSEMGSSQDISDSCLGATSFKSRCFPSALATTQETPASTELMLWSFVLSLQLHSLSRG